MIQPVVSLGAQQTALKPVWLTFDDGPHQTRTPAQLDILADRDLKATFFVVGARARQQSSLLDRMVGEGHRIGNHSYSHARLTTLTRDAVRREIEMTDAVIAPYVGPDKLFRPPYGATDASIECEARDQGYRTVLWTLETEDWRQPPINWSQRSLDQLNGPAPSVVLMHDTFRATLDQIQGFLAQLQSRADTAVQSPFTL